MVSSNPQEIGGSSYRSDLGDVVGKLNWQDYRLGEGGANKERKRNAKLNMYCAAAREECSAF